MTLLYETVLKSTNRFLIHVSVAPNTQVKTRNEQESHALITITSSKLHLSLTQLSVIHFHYICFKYFLMLLRDLFPNFKVQACLSYSDSITANLTDLPVLVLMCPIQNNIQVRSSKILSFEKACIPTVPGTMLSPAIKMVQDSCCSHSYSIRKTRGQRSTK